MNKRSHKNYSYVWVLGILFFALLPSGIAHAGTLTVTVTDATTCTNGGGTVLLRLSGTTNAHAELPSQANANYATSVVCGNGVTGLGNSCSGTFATLVKLSGLTNAHAEQNSQANYAGNDACISVTSGSVSVGYQATDCTGFDATIGSISGTTNAHVGNGAAYATKICATAAGGQSITIGATAGAKATTVNSGATYQYANDTACTSAATCAAFTLSLSSGSDTITSIKVTETGTVNATSDLSNIALLYDTDGNFSNGVIGTFGTTTAFTTEAATITGSLAPTAGTTYYFYVRYFASSTASTYPAGGQTVNFQITANADVAVSGASTKTGAPQTLAGTLTVRPNATGTTYGSGLSDGGRSAESITISGYGFGAPTAGANREDCTTTTVDRGCVKFVVGGTTNVLNANITSWSNTQIVYTIASGLASDGGASTVEVRAANQADTTPLTFYIYPRITGITDDFGGVDDTGREYAAGDNAADNATADLKDGEIQINGDHFGSAGTVTLLGQTGTQAVVGTRCSSSAYTSTCIVVQVPTSIGNGAGGSGDYVGNLAVTRSSDTKDHTYAGFRILPRVISNTLTADVVGNVVQIDGNHLCQSGTCPPSPPTAGDKVEFDTTPAISTDFVTTPNCTGASKWSHTQTCVKVPAGTPIGARPTKVTSNTSYTSNTMAFTVQSTTPIDPTNPKQYKSDGTTEIFAGGTASTTSVVLKADLTASVAIGMAIQVEVKLTGTSFDEAGIVEGTVGGGGACASCTSLTAARVTVSGLSDGTKHWRARAKNTSTSEYSAWVYYGTNNINETDFNIDTAPPWIDVGSISSGTPGTNGATITWTTSTTTSTTRLEYNTSGTFTGGYDCAGTSECTALADTSPMVNSHSVSLTNLSSGTLYYFRVRSKDAAGNETGSTGATGSFTTATVTDPAKTTQFFIVASTTPMTIATTTYFTILVPEHSPPGNIIKVKSSYVKLTGLVNGGTGVRLQVNGVSSKDYSISTTNPTSVSILYRIVSDQTSALPDDTLLNFNDVAPCTNGNIAVAPCNKLIITPLGGLTIDITSVQFIMTYGYTP